MLIWQNCSGVERVTDLKFQVLFTKDEAQTPLSFCFHDYCTLFCFYSPPPLYPPHSLFSCYYFYFSSFMSALSFINGVSVFFVATFLSQQLVRELSFIAIFVHFLIPIFVVVGVEADCVLFM